MHFKHPEILWFLFLLIIPVIVHLFQLRRFRKEYFTNVRFLKELSIQTRKSSKIKKWLLLATRMLLLAALIFAFAQPFFKAKDSKGSANEMFIVLDNSFSMQAKGQNGELLRRAVEDLLASTPENATFSLLTNSDNYWNTDIKTVRRDLQNLSYSASSFNIESQLAKIRARQTAADKDVIVVTDGQGTNPSQLSGIGKGINAWFVVPEAQQKTNAAIDTVYLHQTLDAFYEIGVKVSSNNPVSDLPVALYNNGKLIAKSQVSIKGKTETVNFTIPKEDFHGYASVNDKGLEYDNTYFFSLSKPVKLKVTSIGENAKSGFLGKIFTSDEFEYRNAEPGSVDYNQLEQQDAIILNELREIPQALQTTLKAFAERGGNVVIVPSMETPVAQLNSFLIGFGKVSLGSFRTTKQQITRISFGHPLYSGVFEKKVENFQYPSVNGYFPIQSTTPAALAYEDQSPFLTAIKLPISHVYVFSAPINRDNSNFQNSPLIVPTFYNMVQRSNKNGITAVTIGESKPFIVEAGMSRDQILKIANDKESFIPVQQALNNKVWMTFADYPQQAGNYGIFRGSENIGNISFNYARTEGSFDGGPQVFGDHEIVNDIATVFDKLQSDRTQNEIWKWFVILALLFLITEILIQKFVK